MSFLSAKILRIQSYENLNIVSFESYGLTLKMMSLDLSDAMIVGTNVLLNIKATSVAIAKKFDGEISYSNQLPVIIDSIENGELLCSLKLAIGDDSIESIITVESSKRMDLQKGDEVIALLKANELSISKIIE